MDFENIGRSFMEAVDQYAKGQADGKALYNDSPVELFYRFRDQLAQLRESGAEFLAAVDAMCDWMNEADISADHESEMPEDYERVSKSMDLFRQHLTLAERA